MPVGLLGCVVLAVAVGPAEGPPADFFPPSTEIRLAGGGDVAYELRPVSTLAGTRLRLITPDTTIEADRIRLVVPGMRVMVPDDRVYDARVVDVGHGERLVKLRHGESFDRANFVRFQHGPGGIRVHTFVDRTVRRGWPTSNTAGP